MLNISSKLCCVLVDDEPTSLEILNDFASTCSFLKEFKLFSSSKDALQYINSNPIDLLITDINMPKLNGFDLINQIKYPIEVIFVSGYTYTAQEIFESNIFTFLPKPFSYQSFEKAVSKVYSHYVNTRLENVKKRIIYKYETLSPREQEMFDMIGRNFKNKEIAESLFISTKTVENTKINICKKLEIEDSLSLSRLAYINYFLTTASI